MKINYDLKQLMIYAENESERILLDSNYLKTKLAYVLVEHKIEGLTVTIDEGDSFFCIKKEVAKINRSYSKAQIIYMIRIIVDAYVVSKKALPLHAAMIEMKGKSIIIFGNTHGGKTTLACALKEIVSDSILIGDDHVIVSKEGVMGNSFSRFRLKNGLKEVYIENACRGNMQREYYIIDIDMNSLNAVSLEIFTEEYLKQDLSHITKYLEQDFLNEIEQVHIERFIGMQAKYAYKNELESFIKGAKRIICIKGSLESVVESLSNLEGH